MTIQQELAFVQTLKANAGTDAVKNKFSRIIKSLTAYDRLINGKAEDVDKKIKGEKWKSINHPYWKAYYSASNLGRIKDKRTGKLRKPILNKINGFLQVMLIDGQKTQLFRLARLVGQTWLPIDNSDDRCIRYKNGKSLDNRACNLFWDSSGGRIELRGPAICNEVKLLHKQGMKLKDIAVKTGLSYYSALYVLYNKKRKRATGKPKERFNFNKGHQNGPYEAR